MRYIICRGLLIILWKCTKIQKPISAKKEKTEIGKNDGNENEEDADDELDDEYDDYEEDQDVDDIPQAKKGLS